VNSDVREENMNTIEVCCEVREYPDDDKSYQTLRVRNHWNRSEKVVIELDDKKYVFIANHLQQAINNACNAH